MRAKENVITVAAMNKDMLRMRVGRVASREPAAKQDRLFCIGSIGQLKPTRQPSI